LPFVLKGVNVAGLKGKPVQRGMPKAEAATISREKLMEGIAAQIARDPEITKAVEESRQAAKEGRVLDVDEALNDLERSRQRRMRRHG
jgi:hypothetical protein